MKHTANSDNLSQAPTRGMSTGYCQDTEGAKS
jgi:hypothetical protein